MLFMNRRLLFSLWSIGGEEGENSADNSELNPGSMDRSGDSKRSMDSDTMGDINCPAIDLLNDKDLVHA